MKKFKIFISVLLIFSLLPIYASFAQEEEYEIVLTETDGFKKLSAFGILTEEDEELEYYDEIPRGLFMKYAMKCYFGEGVYPTTEEAGILFSDVSEGTDGAREIAVASKLGIVNGNGSEFRPDDSITSSEAAKVLVSILGYGEIAENTGGYPTGYLTLANRLDIFDGCSFTESGCLAAEDLLTALVNTLEAEVMEISAIHSYNPGITRTYTTEGKTLLEHVFGIYREEGIVESNEYTSIYGLTDVDEGRVKINDIRYIENESGATELLGYSTECYYKMDAPEYNRVIVYIAPYKNNIVSVSSEYIEDSLISSTSFGYYKDAAASKATDVKLAKSATLIYNGGQKSLAPELLSPETGTVTLIDNNEDNVYDVAVVMSYRTILVSGVSPSSYTVSDMLGGDSIILDPEDDEYDVVIDLDGEKADFAAIAARYVISYAESNGCKKDIKYVKISTKTIEGTPESIDADAEIVTINGTDYPINANLAESISLKDSGTYYLDFSGRIVARKISKDVVYGYLNGVIKDSGLKDSIQAQIFTENDRWVELELKDKITYNGKSEDSELFYNDCMATKDYRQLITYTVDEAGRINMIKLAESFAEYSAEEENAIEQDIFRKYDEIASVKYRSGLKALGSGSGQASILLSDSTKVFVVPDQTEAAASKDEFYMMPRSEFEADATYTNVTAYDLDKIRTAGALVIRGHKKAINSKSSFMVVDEIVRTLNSDDTAVKGIKGYYKNSLITLAAKDDSIFLDSNGKAIEYSEGDVIQFTLDVDGNISSIVLRYDYSAGTGQSVGSTLSYASNTFVANTVYYTDASANKFITDGETKSIVGTDGSTIISVYDTETKTLTPGSLADLEKGNKFIARVVYYVADEIIVYH